MVAAGLIASGSLALAACGGERSGEGEEAEAAEVEQASARAVPAALASAESGAEDIVADALSGDRAALVARASELAAAEGPAGVPAAALAELRRSAARLKRVASTGSFVEVALAANAISRLMPRLYRRFEPGVAPGILSLDYLDREAQLRSLAREPRPVAAAVRSLARTWARVRPGVLAAGGADEARAYQTHVARMRRLSPTAEPRVQAEARRGLELVDRLERAVRR